MKLTNLSQVREALELAEQNSNQTFKIIMCCDQLKNALVAIGERYGIAGHCATLTALGRDLLAAIRDAARVPELVRERDEARASSADAADLRAAVDTLTRERDEACHSADIEHAAAAMAIQRLARREHRPTQTAEQRELEIIADIYSELGGGPSPEAARDMGLPELATHRLTRERDEARRALLDVLDQLRDCAHEVAAEDCPYVVERPDQSILSGLRDGWFQGMNRALSVMQGSIAGIRSAAEAAYTSTGGTVPAETPAPSEPSDDVPPECVKPDHELYECPGDGLCPYCDEYAAAMSDMAPAPDEPAQ